MSEETAIVTRSENGKVWISGLRSACGGCMQQASCATPTLAKMLPTREYPVDGNLGLQVGDKVCVSIDDSSLLFGSVLLYILPLLLMLAGIALADSFLPQTVADDWLPEIALALLLSAFALIHRLQSQLLHLFVIQPRITKKI